jgi:hypothetical protein
LVGVKKRLWGSMPSRDAGEMGGRRDAVARGNVIWGRDEVGRQAIVCEEGIILLIFGAET